jgi:hypothetical protein
MKTDKNITDKKSTAKKTATKKPVVKKAAAKAPASKTKKTAATKTTESKKVVAKKVDSKKVAPAKAESTFTEEVKKKTGFLSKLIDNFAGNVKEGAIFVGEKVAETSAKAYVAGTEIVHETSDKIHDFTEKQALHKEEHKIEERQTTLTHAFGQLCLAQYLESGSLPKSFLTTKPIDTVVAEYKANTERLLEIETELENL